MIIRIKRQSMKKINYGIDAPNVIRNFFIIGILFLVLAIFLPEITIAKIKFQTAQIAFSIALVCIIEACLMLLYSKVGKFKHRDRMLKLYEWKGDERVLDVGTGLGLLMIGAAKKLTSGKSVGIDIWNNSDLSNNTFNQAKQNVSLENVDSKTEILSENILHTSFADNYFDVVVSNLCLHNIYDKGGRETACKEIFRILKKDGVAIISDFRHTGDYKKTFEKMGMNVEKIGTYYFDTFPPLTIIKARKKS